MSTIVQFKILAVLTALFALIAGVYIAAQKPAIRNATAAEKKQQTQAMTGWAKTFSQTK